MFLNSILNHVNKPFNNGLMTSTLLLFYIFYSNIYKTIQSSQLHNLLVCFSEAMSDSATNRSDGLRQICLTILRSGYRMPTSYLGIVCSCTVPPLQHRYDTDSPSQYTVTSFVFIYNSDRDTASRVIYVTILKLKLFIILKRYSCTTLYCIWPCHTN